MSNRLVYDSVWESIFEGDEEKVADWNKLSELAMKYDQEVQLFFGTPEELKYLKELRVKALKEELGDF